jgi:hypothetical protein
MRCVTNVRRGVVLLSVTLAVTATLGWSSTYGQRTKPQQAERATVEEWTEANEEATEMADSRWVSTSGDLNSAASWSPLLPTTGGSWFFDGSSQQDVLSNLAAFSAIDTDKIRVQAAFQGGIGADGNALFVPVRSFIHQGTGSVFYKYNSPAALFGYFLIDSPNLQDAFTWTANGSTNCSVFVRSGGVRFLDGSGPLRRLVVGSLSSIGPTVEIGSSFGSVTYYHQSTGFVTTKSDLGISTGDCIIDGGLLIYHAEGTDAWNRIVVAGGTVQYNGTGNLTECIIQSGTLDMTQDSRIKTIDTLIIMPGGSFLTHDNITVGKKIDLRDSLPILP